MWFCHKWVKSNLYSSEHRKQNISKWPILKHPICKVVPLSKWGNYSCLCATCISFWKVYGFIWQTLLIQHIFWTLKDSIIYPRSSRLYNCSFFTKKFWKSEKYVSKKFLDFTFCTFPFEFACLRLVLLSKLLEILILQVLTFILRYEPFM